MSILTQPIKGFALVAFIAMVSAMLFAEGVSDWLFTDFSPVMMIGVSFILMGLLPVITRIKFFSPTMLVAIAIGVIFIFYGVMNP